MLLHGVRADRRSMESRAVFLQRAGYSTLLFDFQAHGESPGRHITFGHLESLDARAGLRVLRRCIPAERVGALGVSLGGAAIALADPPLSADALILESVYPTVEQATRNRIRLRLGPLAPLLSPALLVQLEPRLGVPASNLRPIEHVGSLRAPVLVIAGTEDRHTTRRETEQLFAAASEPKELWLIEGATHVDLHQFAGSAYEGKVLEFLRRRLRREGE